MTISSQMQASSSNLHKNGFWPRHKGQHGADYRRRWIVVTGGRYVAEM